MRGDGSSLRVGLVGANWGANHAAAWRQVPGVQLAAVCTSKQGTAEAAARTLGADAAYWDAERMIAEGDIDIVDVTTRPSIRVPIIQAALRAGKNVIQPMPFALDLEGGRAIAEAASGARAVAVVESLHRYAPAFRQAKHLIGSGALGDIHTAGGHVQRGILFNPSADFPYFWTTHGGSGASALRNFGAHLLHTLTWLVAPVKAVAGSVERRHPELHLSDGTSVANCTEDCAKLLVEYEGGATGLLEINWAMPGGKGFRIDITGSKARLVVEAAGLGPQDAELFLSSTGEAGLAKLPVEDRFRSLPEIGLRENEQSRDRTFPLTAMCYWTARAVREGRPDLAQPGFQEALQVMRTVEAAYDASARREWIAVS